MFAAISIMTTNYAIYVVVGIGLTIWVARTLRIRGRVFLDKGCKGNADLADSLSHLFSVGFYLLHVGFVLLALKLGGKVADTTGSIELLSTKIGLVLVVLGLSHFLHIAIYARIHGKPRVPHLPSGNYAVAAEVTES